MRSVAMTGPVTATGSINITISLDFLEAPASFDSSPVSDFMTNHAGIRHADGFAHTLFVALVAAHRSPREKFWKAKFIGVIRTAEIVVVSLEVVCAPMIA